MSGFSFPGFGFDGGSSETTSATSSFELPTFGLGGGGDDVDNNGALEFPTFAFLGGDEQEEEEVVRSNNDEEGNSFGFPTFGLGGGHGDTTEDTDNEDSFEFPTFGLGGGGGDNNDEGSDTFQFPTFGLGGGDENEVEENGEDVNFSASGSGGSFGLPTFGLGGEEGGGFGLSNLGFGLGGDSDNEDTENGEAVNYSASGTGGGSSFGLPFGLGGGGDDADNSGGGGLGLPGLGLGLGLGSGVTANDIMGGNACAWNRRDVTEDFRTTASQLWTSLTQDGAADLGIAAASPMTGQYEENFWFSRNVCEPVLADENSCFVRGETAAYELPCIVQDKTDFQAEFAGGEEIVLDFDTFQCATPLPADGLYVVGAELKMIAKAEVNVVDEIIDEATVDLHKDHFILTGCEITLRTAEAPLGAGEQFDYTLTLTDKQFSMKAILAGSIVGGVTLMLMFCAFCWCCCRRRQVKKLVSYGDLESGKRKNKKFKNATTY